MAANTENDSRRRDSRLRVAVWSAIVLIMLLPFIAMQFTDEVDWNLADFIVAGVLLAGTALMFELAVRKVSANTYRAAVGVALAAALPLIWINLAVGIIGSEDNPANLMYVAVLAVGIIGTLITRGQSHGMARVLFAIALMQALVAGMALIAGLQHPENSAVPEILLLNGFFVAMWFTSAWLFRKAARREADAA